MTALLGPSEWAMSLGKETSDTSFSVGALKHDEKIITTLYPSKFPEKIWSLLFPLYLADSLYLKVDKIDKHLGEMIIALDLLDKKKGSMHVGDLVDISMFRRITKGTVVENYRKMDPDPAVLRDHLLDLGSVIDNGPTNVVVDQAFNVKGVGCVALGFVTGGKVKRHQELFTCPGGKRTIVRSIQIHDRDQEEAPNGARVGLALKNISPDDLPRGTSLSPQVSDIEEIEKARIRFRISDHWIGNFNNGDHFHVSNSLQFVPSIIENVSVDVTEVGKFLEADVLFENRIWHRTGDHFGLVFLDSSSFRFLGSGETI